jgi:hypothetical protein
MATQERDELLHLVQELPDDEVHELLTLVRRHGTAKTRTGRPGWVGLLREGPDFAKRAKDTLRLSSAAARDPGRGSADEP